MGFVNKESTTGIKYLLSIIVSFLFWIFLGSSFSQLFYSVISYKNSEVVGSIIYKYLFVNFPFIALALGIYFSIFYISKTSFISLINPKKQINQRFLIIPFLISLVLLTVYFLIMKILKPSEIIYQPLSLNLRIAFFMVAIIITPLQAICEEILMRAFPLKIVNEDYKVESIGKMMMISIVLGIIFVLPHLNNPEIESSFLFSISYYFLYSFFASFLTLYFNSLEIAVSIHVANNLFIAIFCNYKNSALPSLSFFLKDSTTFYIYDLIVLILIFTVTFLSLKRYKGKES